MTQISLSRISAFVSLILLTLLVGACERLQSLMAAPDSTTPSIDSLNVTYPVDTVFGDFYDYLGGEKLLGPAISTVQESGEVMRQYVEAGLLVYDPHARPGEKFHLEPLGLLFEIEEPPVPNPNRPNEVNINGHIIYEQFLALYRKLGGARFVGRPITEVHYNPGKRRTEQYFENLGFYILDSDQTKSVYLLAYGTFVCDQQCRYRRDPNNLPASKPFLPTPFNDEVARLGYDFVGRPLTEPYRQTSGMEEIIFDNLVMVYETEPQMNIIETPANLWLPLILRTGADDLLSENGQSGFLIWLPQVLFTFPDKSAKQKQDESFSLMVPLVLTKESATSSKVWIRPIVEMVGIKPQPPVSPLDDPLMVFYPTDGDLGHNVPLYFNDFIHLHGGLEVSGEPITEVFRVNEGIYRQCFTNLCLDFDLKAQNGERLYPVSLGEVYKEKYYPGPNDQFGKQNLENIKITVWEDKPYVTSSESQVVNVLIRENGVSLKNWEPELILIMPDNQVVNYYFPPSDEDGKSSVRIPPVAAPSGTLIPYRVCLRGVRGDTICEENNYLIWNIPK